MTSKELPKIKMLAVRTTSFGTNKRSEVISMGTRELSKVGLFNLSFCEAMNYVGNSITKIPFRVYLHMII